MTSVASQISAAIPMDALSGSRQTTGDVRPFSHDRMQRLARLAGLLFLVTFATSIPPVVYFYADALGHPDFILQGGFDRRLAIGACLELLLIMANIGTALTLYPALKRGSDVLALGYVAARLTECGLIAVGIIALMALNTMRLTAGASDPATLIIAGASACCRPRLDLSSWAGCRGRGRKRSDPWLPDVENQAGAKSDVDPWPDRRACHADRWFGRAARVYRGGLLISGDCHDTRVFLGIVARVLAVGERFRRESAD